MDETIYETDDITINHGESSHYIQDDASVVSNVV